MRPDDDPWAVSDGSFPVTGSLADQCAFLLRYAILAPSSHNSQPWRFAIGPEQVDVLVDEARWLSVADADQRELYVSAGCAVENLVTAARRFGVATAVELAPDPATPALAARIRISRGVPDPDIQPLIDAIRTRRTIREPFDPRPLDPDALDELRRCGDGAAAVILVEDPGLRARADTLTAEADARQFADPAWRDELSQWIGAGAFGHPWLVAKLSALAVRHLDLGRSEARRDHTRLVTAPVLGAIVTREDSLGARVHAGRVLERAWLRAETLGLSLHPMNQILQLPETKAELRAALPDERPPQILFRLGRAAAAHAPSPRRPLRDVLVT